MTGARGPRAWVADFVLLAAVWGSSFLFMRMGALGFGPFATAFLRVAIAAVFLAPLLLWRGQWPALRQRWATVALVGTLNSALPFVFYAYAVTRIPTGLSSILNATVPLFGALVAWLWLRERPGRWRVLGLAVGFAGVALLAWGKASFMPLPGQDATGWAVLACLGATLCYGIAASAARRWLPGYPPLALAAGSQLGASAALLLPALWSWPAVLPGPAAWAALLAVGVLCTGIAYVLYFRLIDEAGPTRALAVTFVVPVFAVLYGVLFLGESVTPWMLGCALVILVGTGLSTGLLRPALR